MRPLHSLHITPRPIYNRIVEIPMTKARVPKKSKAPKSDYLVDSDHSLGVEESDHPESESRPSKPKRTSHKKSTKGNRNMMVDLSDAEHTSTTQGGIAGNSTFSTTGLDIRTKAYTASEGMKKADLLEKRPPKTKTIYDAQTIARDILRVAGMHPTLPALNAHLERRM